VQRLKETDDIRLHFFEATLCDKTSSRVDYQIRDECANTSAVCLFTADASSQASAELSRWPVGNLGDGGVGRARKAEVARSHNDVI